MVVCRKGSELLAKAIEDSSAVNHVAKRALSTGALGAFPGSCPNPFAQIKFAPILKKRGGTPRPW